MSVYRSVECAMHASFVPFFQSLHHWIVPFFVHNFVCIYDLNISRWHSTKETKLILISLAASKWDRRFLLLLLQHALRSIFIVSFSKEKVIFLPIDGNGWRHCNYYVSDYYICNTVECVKCEWNVYTSLRVHCLPLFVIWIFMRWAHFTLSASFSHLFNRHTHHVYYKCYSISNRQSFIQCNHTGTCQVSADNEPIYCYWIGFFAPHNVYKLRAREMERKRGGKT